MNILEPLPPPQTLMLASGRRLAWYEFGDPNGIPCIYTTGTPTSGIAGAFYHESALAAAVRWISPDKPGYGHSDRLPGRRLLDWPSDIAWLAEHLRLNRFAVAGESGGGPHALTLCYKLPKAITTCLLMAGVGSMHTRDSRRGMHWANRMMFGLARRAPLLLWPAMMQIRRSALRTTQKGDGDGKALRKRLAALPPADRELYAQREIRSLLNRAGAEALRPGVRAAIEEASILARPWGFELSTIGVSVHLWHGTEDANVPVNMARAMASVLPRSTLRIVEGSGHLVSFGCHTEIMTVVRHAATAATGARVA